MTADRGGRKVEIFTHALMLEGDARRAYLDEQCGDDPALRRAVERLLGSHRAAGRFLETPAVELGGRAFTEGATEEDLSGSMAGAYRLLSRIGGGGMGSVYLAERADSAFEKRVAVKLVHPGTRSMEILKRFENERQVLASLEHPHIARLIDGGVTDDGVPFIVMEHVEGEPIDTYCQRGSVSIDERLRIFIDVCHAVHYAHQRLVVHRDLKPGNILVTDDGIVKLLDFGIAKVLAETSGPGITRSEVRVMTPRYASPEQVTGEPVTTASDVYALGILLYELLTGIHPFAGVDTPARKLERAIIESRPEAPSTRARTTGRASGTGIPDVERLARRLRGDLDTIVLMALRREPERRYSSAQQLAADVAHHLAGEPVVARPDTLRYVVGKFVRRNAVSVGVVSSLLALVFAAAIVSTTLYVRAGVAQRESDRQRRSAEGIAGFLGEMLGSIHPEVARGRDVTILLEILDQASHRIDNELASNTPAAAELHLTMGRTYRAIAHFDAAERHLTRAEQLTRTEAERDAALRDTRTRVMLELGTLRADTGQPGEAEPLLREAIGLADRGPSRGRLADVSASLARTITPLGKLVEADSLYRHALMLRREGHDRAPADTAATAALANALSDLGGYLTYYGARPDAERRREAEPLLREAVEVARASGDLVVLSSALHELSDLMKRLRRFDEAVPLVVESLALKRRLWGERHPSTALTLTNLAGIHEFMGNYEEAEPPYLEALEVQVEALGPRHVEIGTTLNNLGGLYRKMGRHAEADDHFARAVDIYRAALGAEHAWVAIAQCNHALALLEAGETRRAEAEAREGLRITWLTMSASAGRLGEAELMLGRCLLAERQPAKAESLLVSALERFESLGVSRTDRVRDTLRVLSNAYETLGDEERLAVIRERLAELEATE